MKIFISILLSLLCVVNALEWKLIRKPGDLVNEVADTTGRQLIERKNLNKENVLQTVMHAQMKENHGYHFLLKLQMRNCEDGSDCEPTEELCSVETKHVGNDPELLDFYCVEDMAPLRQQVGGQTLFQNEDELIEMFGDFKEKYGRVYETRKEELARYFTFRENMQKAELLQRTERGTAKYGATIFADIPQDEFKRHHTSGRWDLSPNSFLEQATIPVTDAPDNFDWRDHNAVSEVKNQGSCGSCWAFSTTGNIEGQWAIHKDKLVSLSEQELVDCDKIDDGCEGGLPTQAYEEIMRIGGLETEKDYPYDGSDDKCSFDKSEVAVTITGALNISTDENDMKAWLYKNGPISIGINANGMQFYMGGISHPWKIFCNPSSLDHGVLIVGYGVQDGTPFWIIKNSWGPSWGEKGYYLVYRGSGVCGLNQMPTSAKVE